MRSCHDEKQSLMCWTRETPVLNRLKSEKPMQMLIANPEIHQFLPRIPSRSFPLKKKVAYETLNTGVPQAIIKSSANYVISNVLLIMISSNPIAAVW